MYKIMRKAGCHIYRISALSALFIALLFLCGTALPAGKYEIDTDALLYPAPQAGITDFTFCRPYVDFMKQVYDRMDSDYYLEVSAEKYEAFVERFRDTVLTRLRDRETLIDPIKYLGAGLMVNELKDPEDTFTNFYPPREAEEFKQEALGYALGLGISGERVDRGYLISRVELRSDAYAKGVRAGDIVLKIDGRGVPGLSDEELNALLYPPLGAIVNMEDFFSGTQKTEALELEVIEFFEETLTTYPTGIPGMYYVKINQFNQKTGDDLAMIIRYFKMKNMNKLVLDVRDNGGGPPLAARDILGMFLPPQSQLFYFQRKNRPKAVLTAPFSSVRYDGQMAILTNRKSGSASELFAGTLGAFKRAALIGDRTAGKTFLKSMYNFDDNSMLLLTTSMAYMYNGERFDLKGIKPDFTVTPDAPLFPFVAKCMELYYEE